MEAEVEVKECWNEVKVQRQVVREAWMRGGLKSQGTSIFPSKTGRWLQQGKSKSRSQKEMIKKKDFQIAAGEEKGKQSLDHKKR